MLAGQFWLYQCIYEGARFFLACVRVLWSESPSHRCAPRFNLRDPAERVLSQWMWVHDHEGVHASRRWDLADARELLVDLSDV